VIKEMQTIEKELISFKDPKKKEVFVRFFKTGEGEYGEGDQFLGLSVPLTRKTALKYRDLSMGQIQKIISNEYHECRLAALMILVYQYQHGNKKKEIFNFYIKNIKRINNWDLVDLSVYHIVGDYLLNKDRKILYKLAKSKNLWERRVAMVSTFAFIKNGEFIDTFKIAEILLGDKEDLIHKACGWMLREVGKRISEKKLVEFLEKNSPKMPRTMLRYAIERLPESKRQYFLKK
jgi:3-methyladenine DNA glycosylase AlkD